MQGILLAAGHAACCWTRPVNASWATWATSTTLLELRRDALQKRRPLVLVKCAGNSHDRAQLRVAQRDHGTASSAAALSMR